MKTLNKLNINPEKTLKSDELLILRGGYSLYDSAFNCDGSSSHICVNMMTCEAYEAYLYCKALDSSTTGASGINGCRSGPLAYCEYEP